VLLSGVLLSGFHCTSLQSINEEQRLEELSDSIMDHSITLSWHSHDEIIASPCLLSRLDHRLHRVNLVDYLRHVLLVARRLLWPTIQGAIQELE